MAANTSPIFPAVVRNVGLSVVPNGAITARTAIAGVTGLGLLFTAGANGSRIDQCTLQATGTTLAGLLDFWVYDGTASRMLSETLVAVVAASTTVAGWTTVVTFSNLVIPSGYGLYLSSQVGSQLVGAITTGGDY